MDRYCWPANSGHLYQQFLGAGIDQPQAAKQPPTATWPQLEVLVGFKRLKNVQARLNPTGVLKVLRTSMLACAVQHTPSAVHQCTNTGKAEAGALRT
jgi:hypothetical protein